MEDAHAKFIQLIDKLSAALNTSGWRGRFVVGSIWVQAPVLECLFQLHPLAKNQRAWAMSAGVYVPDWRAVRLSMCYTDGHCVLEMPRRIYHFGCMDNVDSVFANACLQHHPESQADIADSISQEAVDMFVDSVVYNAGGACNRSGLVQALCEKIQRSEAWR
jgi:hypothetical protein